MRFAGLMVMPTGFFLTLASLELFPANKPLARLSFVLCGIAVEALGLIVALRGHMEAQEKKRV
jgi:hypothetical protein